ncbi:GNAT family N-acetyltransferase [Actinomadura oligospora]|uniref:GNAT family N-acetyltransferase n=1 Tax=Actinomadura oligospora TaxID=111804 RepID=UPI0007E8D7A2|nr:GNAT family N-acetyltransferase [Actinomadura oligospora]
MIRFDLLVHEAWPAAECVGHEGWVFRSAGGVTKRANSVWPAVPVDDPDAAVDAAERFYADRGLPSVFSLSDDPELDALLERRGYELVDPTLLMSRGLPGAAPAEGVEIADEPSGAWVDTWWSVDGRYADQGPAARTIITGVRADYATFGAGVGRGVPQGDWYGIYCMAVRPEARRRGVARQVLRALLHKGAAGGASRAYLCVTEKNLAAQALYAAEGFEVAGRYHYRVRAGTVRGAGVGRDGPARPAGRTARR